MKKAGKIIEGSVQYNISPFHTTDLFVQNALEQERMGASLIHVEDMAGLMTPEAAYELISALKKALKIPVHLQCHCTGGMAEMAYWEAIRAGADGLDVCVSSMSMGPAQPPVESFIAALKGTSRDPNIDLEPFSSINRDFIALRKKYADYETKLIGVDVGCLKHQIPGGMLSNLESQLTAMNVYDRLPDVLAEVTRYVPTWGIRPWQRYQPDVRRTGHYQCSYRQPLFHGQPGNQGLLQGNVRTTARPCLTRAVRKSPR